MDLKLKIPFDTLINSPNLAEEIDEESLTKIGNFVYEGWSVDKQSRADWEEKMAMALKLALQVKEEKTFPWVGAANVKFPLVTVAAMQYHARAYPALIPGPEIVQCEIPIVPGMGNDEEIEAQEDRIQNHMSFQIIEEDDCWEEQMDKVLFTQPIIGCAFKKTYFDPVKKHNISKMILAENLYIPYYATSLESASRITEMIRLLPNEIYERMARGTFCGYEGDDWPPPARDADDVLEVSRQEAQGVIKPSFENDPSVPFEFLEQHCWIDLDGDGYQEPYIITIRKDTRQVCRIVARFFEDSVTKDKDGKVLSIEADHFYTKFPFIPSPDGGIYDIGFGILLGPLNASIDTIVNQLLDAGTLSNTAGGFLGRGVKMKSGDNQFRPFEWKRVDSTGDDLQKGIFPLPVREPSPVLFQLLDLLINYGERIGMATDPMTGQNVGQNTKAHTMDAMLEEGQRVFNGIFKRTHRSLKSELRKLFRLNQYFFYPEDQNPLTRYPGKIRREDYMISDKCVHPAADPFMSGETEKRQQAIMIKQSSMTTPGYNRYKVEKRFLKAIKATDIEDILPDPRGPNAIPPIPNPKVQVEQMKMQMREMELKMKMQQTQMELMAEADVNRAKIAKLEAEAVKALADAQGVESGHAIALLEAQIGALKLHQDGISKVLEIIQKESQGDREHVQFQQKLASDKSGGMANVGDSSGNP